MKKLLLSAIALCSILSTEAQYTITEASAPLAGEVNYTFTDSLPYRDGEAQVDKGNAGTDQTWDLVDIDLDAEFNTAFENPSDVSAYAADFPEAELAFPFAGLGWGFIDVSATGMEWIGISIEENGFIPPGSERHTDPETQAVFPSTFETTYTDDARLNYSFAFDTTVAGFDIDSARIKYTSSQDVSFDATGELTTLYGTFLNTLRQRVVATELTEFDVCVKVVPLFPCTWVSASTIDPSFGGEEVTTVTYNWYNEKSKFPLATLTYNETDDTLQIATINADDALLSVAAIGNDNRLTIYPNPASEALYFSNAAAISSLNIIDLTGKTLVNSIPSNGRVDLTRFENGVYIVSVTTQSGQKLTERLVVAK